MGQAFDKNGEREHVPRVRRQQQVKRTILSVRLEQAVEPKQACQQSADPENGGSDPGEQIQIRADAEGYDCNHSQEEKRSRKRAASSPSCQPEVTKIKCDHAGP